ncbi:MAG: uracil phosphoribosyltransferase [Candidatus Altimarinota bacterium]
MEQAFLTQLRDKDTSRNDFRSAAEKLAEMLAQKTFPFVPRRKVAVETPLSTAEGEEPLNPLVIIPILRSGLAILPAFLRYYPEAAVGFIGLRRDEATAIAAEYYRNLPPLSENTTVLFIDPMLATGGSAVKAIEIIRSLSIPEEQMIFASMIAAPEGIQFVEEHFPKVQKVILQIDDHLNPRKFIVPGIGDFGDRYFGTEAPDEKKEYFL